MLMNVEKYNRLKMNPLSLIRVQEAQISSGTPAAIKKPKMMPSKIEMTKHNSYVNCITYDSKSLKMKLINVELNKHKTVTGIASCTMIATV